MKVLHRKPCPTAPRAAVPWFGRLRAGARLAGFGVEVVLALAPLLLASCTDDVAANCPPLKYPEVLTVAAGAGNPCAARKGEPPALLALQVVLPAVSGR